MVPEIGSKYRGYEGTFKGRFFRVVRFDELILVDTNTSVPTVILEDVQNGGEEIVTREWFEHPGRFAICE